jgi:hypothetical protein
MNEANLTSDYLPDPPTPTNKALDLGYEIALEILNKCFKASSKSTNYIFLAGLTVL